MEQGHETSNFGDYKLKDQGQTTPKYVTNIHFGEMSQGLSDELQPNLAYTYYGSKCPVCYNLDAKGQTSRSHKAKDRL